MKFMYARKGNNYTHSHFSNCTINAASINDCEFHNCTINSAKIYDTSCIEIIASQDEINRILSGFTHLLL